MAAGQEVSTATEALSRRPLERLARRFSLHVLPEFILMKPDRVCVSPDKLLDVHAIDRRRPPNALLLTIDEDGHELLLASFARSLLRGSEFSLTLGQGNCSDVFAPHCSACYAVHCSLAPSTGRAHSKSVSDLSQVQLGML